MAITDSDLREIYANAPVAKETFEVICIKASWFEYYLQNTFTDDIEVELEDGSTVTAEYCPMSITQASDSSDLIYERSVVVQHVNDIIATELAMRDPELNESPVIESRGYVMYRDGTVSSLKTDVISTEVSKAVRDEQGCSFTASTTPVNSKATGERSTVTRVPMLKGFL